MNQRQLDLSLLISSETNNKSNNKMRRIKICDLRFVDSTQAFMFSFLYFVFFFFFLSFFLSIIIIEKVSPIIGITVYV